MEWFFDITNDVLNMMDGFYQPDPTPLPTLPNEILLKIFSLVGSTHATLISLSLVCRQWSQLCFEDELWNHLSRTRWKNIPKSVVVPEEPNGWFQFYKRRHMGGKALFPITTPHPIENCFDSACPVFLENLEGKRCFSCSTCKKPVHVRSSATDIEDLAKSGEKSVFYSLPTDPEIQRWENSSFNVLVVGNSGAGKTAFRRKLFNAARQNGNAWASPRNNVVETIDKEILAENVQRALDAVTPAEKTSEKEDYEALTVVLSERSNFQYPVAFNMIESHGPLEEIAQWIDKYGDKFNKFNFDSITLGADPRLPIRPARTDKGIHLVVYCIDITDHKTFSNLERIYRILRNSLAHCPIILLVCKADLKKDYLPESEGIPPSSSPNSYTYFPLSSYAPTSLSSSSSSYYSMLYNWYSPSSPSSLSSPSPRSSPSPPPSLIPLHTLSKFAKKSGLGVHLFSENDSEQKSHVIMDSMAHLIEYGKPRNSSCCLV